MSRSVNGVPKHAHLHVVLRDWEENEILKIDKTRTHHIVRAVNQNNPDAVSPRTFFLIPNFLWGAYQEVSKYFMKHLSQYSIDDVEVWVSLERIAQDNLNYLNRNSNSGSVKRYNIDN